MRNNNSVAWLAGGLVAGIALDALIGGLGTSRKGGSSGWAIRLGLAGLAALYVKRQVDTSRAMAWWHALTEWQGTEVRDRGGRDGSLASGYAPEGTQPVGPADAADGSSPLPPPDSERF